MLKKMLNVILFRSLDVLRSHYFKIETHPAYLLMSKRSGSRKISEARMLNALGREKILFQLWTKITHGNLIGLKFLL